MVREHLQLPRQTPYRSGNASSNHLFSDLIKAEDERLYAILAHVPTHDNRRPKYIDLIIPDNRYRSVELFYDWLPLLAFQAGGNATIPTEDIELPSLRFKGEIKKKAEGA